MPGRTRQAVALLRLRLVVRVRVIHALLARAAIGRRGRHAVLVGRLAGAHGTRVLVVHGLVMVLAHGLVLGVLVLAAVLAAVLAGAHGVGVLAVRVGLGLFVG